MKFLVLALCVCAASAASFGASSFGGYKPYKPYSPAAAPVQAAAKVYNAAAAPFQVAAKAVGSASLPVVAPVAQAAAVAYQPAQQAAAVAYAPAQVAKSVVYNKDAEATILRSDSDIRPDGYNYAYETANGISAEATGVYREVGNAGSVAVKGSYRYVAPDGTPVLFTYIADENGYQPQSDLLPVGPPIPEAIARSLAYIAAHPQVTEYDRKY